VVEFFKDDTTRRCGSCGHRFINPKMDFGCAAYCSYAEQCLGDLPPELVAQKEDLFKDRVAVAVKRHLKSDFRCIGHIARRARHAEALSRQSLANPAVVLIAAYLWDLDTTDSDSPNPTPNTLVARSILEQLKAPSQLVDRVCSLIAAGRADDPAGSDANELDIIAKAEQLALAEEKGN
jgi:HD superfamily phosphodiesterase